MKTNKIILLSLATLLLITFEGQAKAKKKAPDPEEFLKLGREAFYDYRFDEASDFYEQYREAKSKAKQSPDEELDIWERELEIASNAFERVQKIVIVDSISVPRGIFFQNYKLASSAGSVGLINSIGEDIGINNNEISFISENRDYIITSVHKEFKDSDGSYDQSILMESRRLLDGSWESRETFNDMIEPDGDQAFPFMIGDGQTLYFANNGDGSMGGYDIFVAQKDPITGEYLQPLNVGMPFNSPYDDFLMAVDEETGIGWWATDRNSKDGEVTIYVYLIDEIRKNYPDDTDNLEDFAKIASYKKTWEGLDMKKINEAQTKIRSM